MKCRFWVLGTFLLVFVVSCSSTNPTANVVTVQVDDQYPNCCPVSVNLDGGSYIGLAYPSNFDFTSVNPGSHVLKFMTATSCGSGNCVFETGFATKSVTFTAVTGNSYICNVTQSASTTLCNVLVEQGP